VVLVEHVWALRKWRHAEGQYRNKADVRVVDQDKCACLHELIARVWGVQLALHVQLELSVHFGRGDYLEVAYTWNNLGFQYLPSDWGVLPVVGRCVEERVHELATLEPVRIPRILLIVPFARSHRRRALRQRQSEMAYPEGKQQRFLIEVVVDPDVALPTCERSNGEEVPVSAIPSRFSARRSRTTRAARSPRPAGSKIAIISHQAALEHIETVPLLEK
jgi:hypothetical protein